MDRQYFGRKQRKCFSKDPRMKRNWRRFQTHKAPVKWEERNRVTDPDAKKCEHLDQKSPCQGDEGITRCKQRWPNIENRERKKRTLRNRQKVSQESLREGPAGGTRLKGKHPTSTTQAQKVSADKTFIRPVQRGGLPDSRTP